MLKKLCGNPQIQKRKKTMFQADFKDIPLLNGRTHYKPLAYPWAYSLYRTHEKMHWMTEEVTVQDDLKDWNSNLSEGEKNLLTQIFRFFTQGDVDVASGYRKYFNPIFGGAPELSQMMTSFANREGEHIVAYSLLLDTLGLPESEYQAFLQYKEMKDKHDYIEAVDTATLHGLARSIAVYSAFTEGMQLFSSFAMLMNFERFNKMKKMTQIVRWSIKDEDVHVQGMLQLFREFVRQADKYIDMNKLNEEINQVAITMVELESKFIDLAFSAAMNPDGTCGIEGLTPEEMKAYAKFIANKRLEQLGFAPIFGDVGKPLKWLEEMLNATELTNFFENRPTDYGKANVKGSVVEW